MAILEIMSLAAFVPWDIQPTFLKEEIKYNLPEEYKKLVAGFNSYNTECYFVKEQGGNDEYTLTIKILLEENEEITDIKIETIHLNGFSEEETNCINNLIKERMIKSLEHINEF